MYLRFLSAACLFIFVLLSSNSAYGQNSLQGYNFPNDVYGFHHVFNSRDAAGCPTGQGGTAVMPNHAATGEALCDQEAQRLGVDKAHMRWYMSPVFSTWSSPGDNKLCRYQGGRMQIVSGTTGGGKWTNVVVCKYEPFVCGDRWTYELQKSGLNWQLNWTKTKEKNDFANVNGTRFVCMPRICTAATCPDTPANTRNECFLTDEPGEYRKVNGTLCSCPASKDKVGNNCVVDQCKNINGTQATVPTTTTRNAAGNCLCKNGGANPQTCTPPVVPPASVACNDGIDNDGDGKIDLADPGCTSATDTSEENAALAQCSDGIDNDGDGKIDYAPPSGSSIPSTYDFKTPFPGINTASPSGATSGGEGYAIVRTLLAIDPSIPVRDIEGQGWLFYYNQDTANKICSILGYQTATMTKSWSFSSPNDNSLTRWINGAWERRPATSDNNALDGLTCSNPSSSSSTQGDPDCTSATDNTEAPDTVTQCSDGIDNDGDGKIDFIAPTNSTTEKTITFTIETFNPASPSTIINTKTVTQTFPTAEKVWIGALTSYNPDCGIIGPGKKNYSALLHKDCYKDDLYTAGYITGAYPGDAASSNNEDKPGSGWIEAVNGAVATSTQVTNDRLVRIKSSIASTTLLEGDPDCTSATDDSESGDLVCPVGTTKTPTPASPVCFLTATPRTTPAGTTFSLTGYSHLTGSCRIADKTTHDVPPKTISPLVSLGLSVSPLVLHITAVTESVFLVPTQVQSVLTCPAGTRSSCSVGASTSTGTTPATPVTKNDEIIVRDITGVLPSDHRLRVLSGDTGPAGETNYTPKKVCEFYGMDFVSAGNDSDGGDPPNNNNEYLFYSTTPPNPTTVRANSGLPQNWYYLLGSSQNTGVPAHAHTIECRPRATTSQSVISCGCYNPGITPPGTTIPATTMPATYDFSVNFPGVNYQITERDGERSFSRDIVGVVNAHSPSLGLSDPSDTVSFYNNQATADQACRVLGYQTAVIFSDNKFDGTGGRKVAVYENNAWVIKPLSGNNDVINGLRCSSPIAGGTTTSSTVTPPTYTCVSDRCTEGQYFCSAENVCKPAGQPCSAFTCNKNDICDADESCNCSDCTDGDPDNTDKCGLSSGGQQLFCTKDSVISDNTTFPFCFPACLDGQTCATTCNEQVGACCPADTTWNSTEDSCVPNNTCTNTQAPRELKAGYDQPYIACTGNGVATDTHFRYRITKVGSTDAPFISDIFVNGTQVLHPTIAIAGAYTVNCFYGTATVVNTAASATPHTCSKTMTVREGDTDAINGCSRIFAYRGSTLSDEMTSTTNFDASFRCGARLPGSSVLTNPFVLRVGTIAPAFLEFDAVATAFYASLGIGGISSTQAQPYTFSTPSTPVSCAVRVGDGYSTNNYCRVTACVGNNCNVPQAFSVVHSGNSMCTSDPTGTYKIGCNPDAPEAVRTECVEWLQDAVDKGGSNVANGVAFKVKFTFNSTTPKEVDCIKYAAGQMPGGFNLFGNVSCTATDLKNGETYEIYAADTDGSPINSLQTTARTVEYDSTAPDITLKYYTDMSLSNEIISPLNRWFSTSVVAVAICDDKPRGESLACSCAPRVITVPAEDATTKWSTGAIVGELSGADLLRYTRLVTGSLASTQVRVVDTAGNPSTLQNMALSFDTVSPVVSPTLVGSNLTLTATDATSKIWKNRTAVAPAQNPNGIIYRKGSKEQLDSLVFNDECGIGYSVDHFANVTDSSSLPSQTTPTTIPNFDPANDVVTYCVRDNAGNTTRGTYPVITDACFSASNMQTVPTIANYRTLMQTRLGLSNDNQKYGYSFSENPTNAACFRGILATNITTLVTNQLTPRDGNALSNWDTDRALTKVAAPALNTNGYYYYSYPSSASNKILSITAPSDQLNAGSNHKSVIVDGGDIRITQDLMYSEPGKTLVLIARRNSAGHGGNIIIDSSVNRIDAVLIADGGSLQRSNALPGERLKINGRIYSYNTRGGSLMVSGGTIADATAPGKVFSASGVLQNALSLLDAQNQDLERLRPMFTDGNNDCSLQLTYHAYTTATLPILLQRPAGYQGGNCGF